MIAYAIRNKKDKRFVFGFDYRYGRFRPHMRYLKNDDVYHVPKLFSQFDVDCPMDLGKIPKTCEIVQVEIKVIE